MKILRITFESIPAYSSVHLKQNILDHVIRLKNFIKLKTQGSTQEKLIFNNPYDIQKTNEPNDLILSSEEVANSKVNLNGLYGIPALRPYFNFNLFRKDEEGNYFNIENGHKNAERNIVFSIFVTSVSLWNLDPLKYLTQNDENYYIWIQIPYISRKTIHIKYQIIYFLNFHLG